jgi:hypothetical protein
MIVPKPFSQAQIVRRILSGCAKAPLLCRPNEHTPFLHETTAMGD